MYTRSKSYKYIFGLYKVDATYHIQYIGTISVMLANKIIIVTLVGLKRENINIKNI